MNKKVKHYDFKEKKIVGKWTYGDFYIWITLCFFIWEMVLLLVLMFHLTEYIQIFHFIVSVHVGSCSEKRHHLSVSDFVDTVHTYFGDTLASCDENKVETFEESNKAKNAIGHFDTGGDGTVLSFELEQVL